MIYTIFGGRLAVAAKRGPFGFAPALEETSEWLKEFRETGTEPELADGVIEAADERAANKAGDSKQDFDGAM